MAETHDLCSPDPLDDYLFDELDTQPNKMRRTSKTGRTRIHSDYSQVLSSPTYRKSCMNDSHVDALTELVDEAEIPPVLVDEKTETLDDKAIVFIGDSSSDRDSPSPFASAAPSVQDDKPGTATSTIDPLGGDITALSDTASDTDEHSEHDASLFGGSSDQDYMDINATGAEPSTGQPLDVKPHEVKPEVDFITPVGLNCNLFAHQRMGLEWLLEHELGRDHGGILADDMGLGKTVQAISLLLANPPAEDSPSKTTLIVAPLALLRQWPREIADKIKQDHKLKVHIFHGEGKKISRRDLLTYDVVLTNYDSLGAEYKMSETKKEGMVLLDPDTWFHRVILDEGHLIRNRVTNAALGAFRLNATYRLVLSGTPIMNKPDELFPLVCFLKIDPYDDWPHFNRYIARILRKEKLRDTALGRDALSKMDRLRERTMLVRSKQDLIDDKPIIELPERREVIEHCEFDKDELEFYRNLEAKTDIEVKKYQKARRDGDMNFAQVLAKLLRLRQACCHPNLLIKYSGEEDENESEDDLPSADEDSDLEDIQVVKKKKRSPASKAQLRHYYRQLEEDYVPSAKINKTIELLTRIRDTAPGEKIILFSFFTSFLDILEVALRRVADDLRLKHTRFDGRMTPAEKDAAVADFTSAESDTMIILISLKSGNAGLNLNRANHVVILEPYWNPFVEQQAIDRAYRIGQTRPVTVYKVLVPQTVEDRILSLQEAKRSMVELALGTGKSAGERQKIQKGKAGLTRQDMLNLLKSKS